MNRLLDNSKKKTIFITSIKGAEAASAGRRFLRFLAGMASGCLDFIYANSNILIFS